MTSCWHDISKRFQIAVPRVAREQLNIQSGDRLLVDVQDGMLILLPQPQNYTTQLQGLHREIWEGVDTNEHISGERAAWDASQNG
jgi:AbrB family looped-hinge helix DNA binding protein